METQKHDKNGETAARNAGGQFIDFASKEENLHYPGVLDIDPLELAEKMKSNPESLHVIDVRQKEEFDGEELGHIPGSKLQVLDHLPSTIGTLPKDQTIVFVCRSGGRSARAAEYAMGLGYQSVYNLKGGMLLWNEHRLATEN